MRLLYGSTTVTIPVTAVLFPFEANQNNISQKIDGSQLCYTIDVFFSVLQ